MRNDWFFGQDHMSLKCFYERDPGKPALVCYIPIFNPLFGSLVPRLYPLFLFFFFPILSPSFNIPLSVYRNFDSNNTTQHICAGFPLLCVYSSVLSRYRG